MELIKQINEGDFSQVDQFIDALFDVEANEALSLIQQEYAKVNTESPGDAESYLLLILESFWNFFQSQISIIEKADFQAGLQQVQQAAQGFEALQLKSYKDLAQALQMYYAAIVDLKTLNLTSGLEKIKLAKQHFNQIDKYGQYFGHLLDSFEAESLFVSGINFIAQLDYENGQIAIEKASKASKKLAVKHFEKDSLEYNLFTGFGYLYSAFSGFFIQIAKLNSYSFDYFDYAENDVLENALKAIEYLSRAISLSEVARMNLKLAKGVHLLSQVNFSIGRSMYLILGGRTGEIELESSTLRKMVKNARKFFVDIGDAGIIYVRFCKQIESQLLSVEKVAKEKKVVVPDQSKPAELAQNIRNLVKNGKNVKAIDFLMTHFIDFDLFNEVISLKNRYVRLKKEQIAGVISAEDFRVEESKLSKAILDMMDLFELDNEHN